MKIHLFIIAFFCSLLYASSTIAQCVNPIVRDSSFEAGTLYTIAWDGWNRDDGCNTSALDPVHGDSVARSSNGGAYQYVHVNQGVTYYLSFYIKNGASDPYPVFAVGQGFMPIQVPTDDWTLVTYRFTAHQDSIKLWFYSESASFDLFRVSCNLLTDAPEPASASALVDLYPDPASGGSLLEARRPVAVTVYDLSGRLVYSGQFPAGRHVLYSLSERGLYMVHLQVGSESFSRKIWVP